MDYSIKEEIKKAINGEAYIAAMALALTIPDMCCGRNSRRDDYIEWYDKYVNSPSFQPSAIECYALRCAFLHQQDGEIDQQEIMNNDSSDIFFCVNIPRNSDSIRVQWRFDEDSLNVDNIQENNCRIVAVEVISFINSILSGYEEFKRTNPNYNECHKYINVIP